MSELTRETPRPGLIVAQPKRGFRYASESYWLVGSALDAGAAPRDALDLGAGSGIMAMLLAAAGIPTTGVELRAEWGPCHAISLAESDPLPVRLLQADVRHFAGDPVDLVVCNPPFFPAGTGPVTPDPWKAAARTEGDAVLADFVACAARHLRGGGEARFVVPREREGEVTGAGLHPREVWRIGAVRSLVVLRPEPGECAPFAASEDDPRVAGWSLRARGMGAGDATGGGTPRR